MLYNCYKKRKKYIFLLVNFTYFNSKNGRTPDIRADSSYRKDALHITTTN